MTTYVSHSRPLNPDGTALKGLASGQEGFGRIDKGLASGQEGFGRIDIHLC